MTTRRTLLKRATIGLVGLNSPTLLRSVVVGLGVPTVVVPRNPPYDFSTFAATSSFKLLGANILQAPSFVGLSEQPGGAYQYGYMFEQWTSGANIWANWVKPQIDNLHSRGAKHFRCILGGDRVLQGGMTNAQHNTAVNTMLDYVRSLGGMTISLTMMAVGVLSDIGSPSAATQYVVSKSILDNCIVPNQDIVAYFEPGNQESRGADVTVEDAICGLMKADGYLCPIGISPFGQNYNVYTQANFDLIALHQYVAYNVASFYESMRSTLFSALAAAPTKPLMVEETNVFPGDEIDQTMKNYFEEALLATYGHPDVMGMTAWAGQSAAGFSDGYFPFWNAAGSYNPDAMNPATVWSDKIQSTLYFTDWGSANRNLVFVRSLNGAQTITGSQTAINQNCDTPIQHHTITNQDLGTHFRGTTAVSCVGTFSATGDAGATYRISFGAETFPGGVWTEIGHFDWTGNVSGQAINFSGSLSAGGWVPSIRTQRVAGVAVNGSISACAVTVTEGNF